jgi:hypothetical protein
MEASSSIVTKTVESTVCSSIIVNCVSLGSSTQASFQPELSSSVMANHLVSLICTKRVLLVAFVKWLPVLQANRVGLSCL